MSGALPIAVTGGIASGKSEVTRRFEALGIEVLDADLIARELVEPGQPALAEIARRFGAGVIDAAGRLDRRALRAIVFADSAARRDLEAILHPRVHASLQARAQAAAPPYVLLAIPLLAESAPGRYAWLDRVLVVDVPRAVQIQRVMQRDAVERAAAEAALAAQASREARLAMAHDVIVNDGPLAALDAIVAKLHARYLALAAGAA
ncbi:MAG: dephospho-CoA kinase [Chiayiivirga sp.]|uniref:dephospho-CoA kinase n=1 Tax=Chiayiivirga sp. TaxID=2041042 RepID=UPI0025BEC09E|nr:dephospho-CoA kinase [Chiayiivirga sp.]MCI1729421.1 dephospho-CoA kinase [Chiayiivirga sp.]